MIEKRLSTVDHDHMSEYDLNLYRMKGWYCASSGDHEEGEKILREVVAQASSLGYSRVLMLAYYSLGIVDWRRGLSNSAVAYLTESLEVARQARILDKAVAVLSMLTTLHSNLANYKAAVRSGKAAARILSHVAYSELLPSVCVGISYAYTRLADFPKARYWVERYLDCGKYVREGDFAMVYYLIDGYLLLNQGKLQAAKLSLHKCLNATHNNTSAKLLGQLHMNLADIALQQGDAKDNQRYTETSREAYQRVKDSSSILETRMLSLLSELHFKGTCDIQHARDLLDNEYSDSCRYWSARLVCHLLIASDRQNRPVLVSLARKLKIDLLSSTVPAFRILSCLIDGVESESPEPLGWIRALKAAAQESYRGESRFMLMILLKAIGEAYLERDQYRHAEKYFAQALVSAEALGNKPMAASIRDSMSSASARAADLIPFIDSFHAVSKILKEVNQSEDSYQQLLQFALDQTGAERAVLLLQAGGSSKLYVAASLNCDSESVKDVAAISKHVTDRVTAGLEPIIVDDALTDKRTRNFGSIVAHNVLSVACLPLVQEEQLQGVLYLDHNTLPSLFSSRDLKFIGAISNFISTVVTTVQAYRGLSVSNVQLRQDLSRLGQTGAFITNDLVMLRLFERLPAIAQSEVPILIRGESGTGKEIICETLHHQSNRSGHPLIKLNCAAIASSMVEAELFGVTKDAATGVAEREGKLSAANGGSLLLDEIADMPPDVQAKLLRAVEYQEFEKVGSNRTIHVDIRFICATNRDLEDMVKRDKFRHDLYYRINRVVIELPPLRERPDDVELLTEHFLQLFSAGKQRPRFDADVKHALACYEWPGNVRELRNFVERCCILYPGKLVDTTTPEAAMLRSSGTCALDDCSPEQERLLIERTLRATKGNQTKAARILGISLSALRRRMKKFGLDK
ncbi:MAG: sigma 54-interacting transcriptional regulator [candidate division Zixibacteria bacterium]|nr:sigma 54-interacting transcriptional regulator [candidate division Zixibacteria bacterium]